MRAGSWDKLYFFFGLIMLILLVYVCNEDTFNARAYTFRVHCVFSVVNKKEYKFNTIATDKFVFNSSTLNFIIINHLIVVHIEKFCKHLWFRCLVRFAISVYIKEVLHPDKFWDCLCILLKNYNTLWQVRYIGNIL